MRRVGRSPYRAHFGVALVLVAGLALAGCSGGKGNISAGTTVTSAPPQTTSTAPPTTDPAKVAKATAAVLQPGDFPAGWTAQPPDDPGLGI